MGEDILIKLQAPYGRFSRADRQAAADEIQRLRFDLAQMKMERVTPADAYAHPYGSSLTSLGPTPVKYQIAAICRGKGETDPDRS